MIEVGSKPVSSRLKESRKVMKTGVPLLILLVMFLSSACEERSVLYYIQNPGTVPPDTTSASTTFVFNDFTGINITDESVGCSNADLLASQQLLVYQRGSTGPSYQIMLLDLASGEETDLSRDGNFGSDPKFSPDGSRIAYYRDGHLYIMDIDGANARRISQSMIDTRFPFHFTRDGNQIITTTINTGARNVSAIGVLGGGQENLTEWTGGWNPDIAPDSRRIVFVAGGEDQQKIYSVKMDGSDLILLTTEPGVYLDPVYSPDGSSIAFAGQTGFNRYNIYIMTVNGSTLRRLTFADSYDYRPVFLPDQSWIAFNQRVGSNTEIMFVTTDRRYVVNHTNSIESSQLNPVFDPLFPVMYFQSNSDGDYDIWMSDVNYLLDLH